MIRRLYLIALAWCGLSAAFCRAAEPGAKNIAVPGGVPVLKVVPDNALAVVLVNNLGQVDAKLVRVGQQAGLPSTSALAMAKAILGVAEGLDEKGMIAFVVQPSADGGIGAAPLIYVPVTDYAKFIAPFNPENADGSPTKILLAKEPAVAAKKGDYAVLTGPMFEDALKAALAADKNLAAELAPLNGWIVEHDVAAVATKAGITLAVSAARQGLQQTKNSIPAGVPNAQLILAVFEMYDSMFKTIDEELIAATVGLRVDKDANVHLTSSWRCKTDGATSKFLAGVPPLAGKPLADLPAGPYLLAGSGVLPEGLFGNLWKSDFMKLSMQSSGMSDVQFGKLSEISKQSMRGVHGMSLKAGVPADDEAAFQNTVGAVQVENSAKYLETVYKQMDQMQEFAKEAEGPLSNMYEFKKLEIGGAKAAEMTMDLAAGAPQQVRRMLVPMYEKLFGAGGKLSMSYLPADDKTVFFAYSGGEIAGKKFAAFKARQAGLAGDPQVVKTLALLPGNAQWYGVWDVPGTLAFVKQVARAVSEGRQAPSLPDVPAAPPIGFAARASAQGLDTDLVIPAETVKALGQLVPALIQGGSSPAPPLKTF